jgi:hypothetical protein
MVCFQTKKSQFGSILEGLRLENINIFYGHLEYFTYGHLGYCLTISYILCSFGTFYSGFGITYQEKYGNTGLCTHNYNTSVVIMIFKEVENTLFLNAMVSYLLLVLWGSFLSLWTHGPRGSML